MCPLPVSFEYLVLMDFISLLLCMTSHFLLDVIYLDEGCTYFHVNSLGLFLDIGELKDFYVFDACFFLMSTAYFMLSNPSNIVSLPITHNLLE